MTDRDNLVAMLDRAGIPHADSLEMRRDEERTVPALYVGDLSYGAPRTGEHPPRPPDSGGYSGFYTEFDFNADGSLHAVWAWE